MGIAVATLIQELGKLIERSGIPVQCGENEMLITMSMKNGRKQTVKIHSVRNRYGTYSVLRFQSRVCIAQGAAMIRAALKANADSDYGGYALDTTVTPGMIDIVHGYVITPQCEWIPSDVFTAIQRLAAFADDMEQRVMGGDVF
jgi:hypothetical protein